MKKIVFIQLASLLILSALPIVTCATGYLKDEQVSGFNKICYYREYTGDYFAITIKKFDRCPLSFDKQNQSSNNNEVVVPAPTSKLRSYKEGPFSKGREIAKERKRQQEIHEYEMELRRLEIEKKRLELQRMQQQQKVMTREQEKKRLDNTFHQYRTNNSFRNDCWEIKNSDGTITKDCGR